MNILSKEELLVLLQEHLRVEVSSEEAYDPLLGRTLVDIRVKVFFMDKLVTEGSS